MELTVTDLTVARGGIAVLAGVDFHLRAGEALILRGPNGAGKTTLLRTLAGLQPPVAGRIDMAPDCVAYAGHLDAVKSALTVRENLDFWAAIYGAADIDAALAAMDLRALTDRPAQTLSAGQRRRLGLARLALTGRPLWLLDEPTVSLDAASVALFAAMIAGHLAKGGAAVIATHIDLGLTGARPYDLSGLRARPVRTSGRRAAGFDEAFL